MSWKQLEQAIKTLADRGGFWKRGVSPDDVLKEITAFKKQVVCIPRKQLEELREKYGNEPHVKRTSAFKAFSLLLEESKTEEKGIDIKAFEEG